MKLTIYTADCTGDAANCKYPHTEPSCIFALLRRVMSS